MKKGFLNMDEQLKKIIKLIAGAVIFLIIVSAVTLWQFKDFTSVGIGITTGIISGVFILLFQKGFIGDQNPSTNPAQFTVNEATTRTKGEAQIKLELEVDKVYLTGIGLAFTVESVFIGLFGKSVVGGIIDFGFIQLAVITFLFVIFMIFVWVDYKNKKKEVDAAFNNTNIPPPTT